MQTALHTKQQNKILLVLILGSLTAFGPLSMDMYLPGLPDVTNDLKASASLGQLSITACLLGLAAGQLLFGPLSDLQGRRKPLLITLLLYMVASILCGLSTNIWAFIILRFFQGLTGAAGIVIARASARDIYYGKDLTKFIALLAIVNGAAPILAPIFGGIVLNWVTWHAVFYILGIIGLVMFLAVVFFLPETLPEENRIKGNAFSAYRSFGTLFKDRQFMGVVLSQAFISSSMFAYIAASPFVLQRIYDVTPQQFSLVFALNGLGIIITSQVSARLTSRFEEIFLLRTGILFGFSGSILLLFVVFLHLPLWAIMLAFFMVVSSVGVVSTTGFSLAMNRQGKIAGSASALLGILPFAGGAIVSPLVGIAGEQSATPMGIIIFACCLLAVITCLFMLDKKKI